MTPDVIAIIPARGGSKGIPRKNIVSVGGKPLLQWTIEAACAASCVSRIVVSTDDEEIADTARMLGAEVPFLRSANLARDDTPGIDPIIEMLNTLGTVETWACVLQPTSPLRTAGDIDGARAHAEDCNADAVLGVTRVRQHTAWQRQFNDRGWLIETPPAPPTRQQLAQYFCPNGAIYLARTEVVTRGRTLTPSRTVAWEMPPSRSLDIDIEDDLIVAEALLGFRVG